MTYTELNNDIWKLILLHLDIKNIRNILLVKYFKTITDHQAFWIQLFIREFPEHEDMIFNDNGTYLSGENIKEKFIDLYTNGAYFTTFEAFDDSSFFNLNIGKNENNYYLISDYVLSTGSQNITLVTVRKRSDIKQINTSKETHIKKYFCATCHTSNCYIDDIDDIDECHKNKPIIGRKRIIMIIPPSDIKPQLLVRRTNERFVYFKVSNTNKPITDLYTTVIAPKYHGVYTIFYCTKNMALDHVMKKFFDGYVELCSDD